MMPEAAVAVVAPTQKQTERLADAVQHDGLAYTKNELIEKFWGVSLAIMIIFTVIKRMLII